MSTHGTEHDDTATPPPDIDDDFDDLDDIDDADNLDDADEAADSRSKRATRPDTLPPHDPQAASRTQIISTVQSMLDGDGADVRESLQHDERYDLKSMIARGGVGAVLSVRDHQCRRNVAMKILLPRGMPSREQMARFVEEAQVTAQLEHPNIVPVYDVSVDKDGQIFYTMKHVHGRSLADIISLIREGDAKTVMDFPLGRLLSIFVKACDAIAFAHSRGVVHRDLKPENIMVGDFGEVLVVDWGLAKIISRPEGEETSDAPPSWLDDEIDSIRQSPDAPAFLTMEGQVMGTPAYMAPEQALGRVGDIDARTDVYAMGAVLYTILTLHAPFGGDDWASVLRNVVKGRFAPPLAYNSSRSRSSDRRRRGAKSDTETLDDRADLPPPVQRGNLPHCPAQRIPSGLTAVTMHAMAIAPADRYADVQSLQADVEAYLGGFATAAEQASFSRQAWLLVKRHRSVTFLVLGMVLGTLIGTVSYVRSTTAAARSEAEQRQLAEIAAKQAKVSEADARHELYVARLAQIQGHLERGLNRKARDMLLMTSPEFKGWETQRLLYLAGSDRVLRDRIGLAAVSADGSAMVTTRVLASRDPSDPMQVRRVFSRELRYAAGWVGLSPDGATCWILDSYGGFSTFDMHTGKKESVSLGRTHHRPAMSRDLQHLAIIQYHTKQMIDEMPPDERERRHVRVFHMSPRRQVARRTFPDIQDMVWAGDTPSLYVLADATLHTLDPRTNEWAERAIPYPDGPPRHAAMLPDGRHILYRYPSRAGILDLRTGAARELRAMRPTPGDWVCPVFTPDSRYLVVATSQGRFTSQDDFRLELWDLQGDGRLINTRDLPMLPVLISATDDLSYILASIRSRDQVHDWRDPLWRRPTVRLDLPLLPEDDAQNISLLDDYRSLGNAPSSFHDTAFSDDGSVLYSLARDGRVAAWRTATGEHLWLRATPARDGSIQLSRDQQSIVIAASWHEDSDTPASITVLRADDGDTRHQWQSQVPATLPAVHRDGDLAIVVPVARVAAGNTSYIRADMPRVLDISEDRILTHMPGHADQRLIFADDAKSILSIGAGADSLPPSGWYSTENGRRISSWQNRDLPGSQYTILPDSTPIVPGIEKTAVATSSWDDAIFKEYWRVHGVSATFPHKVAMTPDGTRLVGGIDSDILHFHDTATGRELLTDSYNQTIHSLSFSPDGAHLAIGLRDHAIILLSRDQK